MKTMICLFIVISLIFCGCSREKSQAPNKEIDVPNVRAFQDPFTKTFLTSTKEVLPGYYSFRSNTGKYEMAFPAGGVIVEENYERHEKSVELLMANVHLGNYDPIKEVSASLKIDYYSYYDKETIEANLSSLRAEYDNRLTLRKLPLEDRDIYWSTYTLTESNYKYFGVAGYAQNTTKTGGVYFSYEFTCNPGFEKCQQLEKDFNLKTALDWVKQIRFK